MSDVATQSAPIQSASPETITFYQKADHLDSLYCYEVVAPTRNLKCRASG